MEMKEALSEMYGELDYRTSKESMCGFSDSNVYVRYNWVDVSAYREGSPQIVCECETRFNLRRFREKSRRLHRVRERVILVLVVPEQICKNHRWIWDLTGHYDRVMVYNEKRKKITKIHYLRPVRPAQCAIECYNRHSHGASIGGGTVAPSTHHYPI